MADWCVCVFDEVPVIKCYSGIHYVLLQLTLMEKCKKRENTFCNIREQHCHGGRCATGLQKVFGLGRCTLHCTQGMSQLMSTMIVILHMKQFSGMEKNLKSNLSDEIT